VVLPGEAGKGAVKVFGHPESVSGKMSLGPDKISPRLVASEVPPGQFVEMRVVFPRELLTSTSSAKVEPGEGLKEIIAEEAADARSAARVVWLQRLQTLFGLLLAVVSVGTIAFVYRRYGREPRVDYIERYEREPPTDDPPAVVGTIISQKPSVGSREFTATLFDLIRRGVLNAQPVSVKKGGFWSDKTMTDLRVHLSSYDPGSLDDFERKVLNVAKGVLSYDPVNLTDFEKRMREGDEHSRRSYNSSYQGFRNALKREVERRDLVERGPGVWLGWVTLLLGLAGTEWFVFSLLGASVEAVIILIGSSLFVFGIVVAIVWRVFGYAGLALGSVLHPLWVRRTPKGALLHARWQAFRRYLSDFSRMEESPPASLALWEQFLVYGIALGVAEQVLEAARLYAPPEIAQGGSFYSSGYDGSVSGPDGFSLSSLENDFSGTFSPPSSSGSWSGGGGGGGGAW
jgi:uncharacterized membrane protein